MITQIHSTDHHANIGDVLHHSGWNISRWRSVDDRTWHDRIFAPDQVHLDLLCVCVSMCVCFCVRVWLCVLVNHFSARIARSSSHHLNPLAF